MIRCTLSPVIVSDRQKAEQFQSISCRIRIVLCPSSRETL